MRRIGVLMARAANDPEGQKQAAALQRGIEELGWLPGRNVEIEYRWPAGDASRAQALAKELVDWGPDILVANSTPSLVAARQATSTIPIVFVAIADPVAQGFVQGLARPGGNITGFGAEEPSMGAKWVQLLREIAPRLESITVMFNPDAAPFARMFLPAMEAVRASSAFELIISPVRNETEIDRAIAVAGRQQSGGLIVLPDSFLHSRHEMIVALMAKQHLPAIYSVSEFTRSGSRRPDRNPAMLRAADAAESGERMPMSGRTGCCCARAASGHTAAPPRSVMNSRRPMPTMAFLLGERR
jgi:putative ABC transport system substrate-binding protein